MPTITASNGGTGRLAKATVTPFPRENLSVRATIVQARNGSNPPFVDTGVRLRTEHLLAISTTASRNYRAAVKDVNDVWTEWSDSAVLAVADFVPGSGVGSVGSGNDSDLAIEEPTIRFPDLSMGSGQVWMHRTLVGGTMFDEQRRDKWAGARSMFNVELSDLDEEQTLLLHRFFRCLNGPLTPFWFEFTDPHTGDTTRYVVRFRNPEISTQLFGVTYSRIDFQLIELIGASSGGDV